MLIYTANLIKAPVRADVLRSSSMLFSVSHSSSVNYPIPQTITDTASQVSILINKPNWEQNNVLKSLVSHMTPFVASKIIELHSHNIDLGFRFFKWVCKRSTYCYDLDDKIHLLNAMVSSNLFGVAHKAIIVLIMECCTTENEILKLMGALEDLRKIGFRLNYPCYSTLLMSIAKLDMGFRAYLVYTRMVRDGFLFGSIDYKTIINALCKSGFVQAAEMFMSRVLKLGFDLDTHLCTSLVLGNCRRNDLRDAFRVFEIMSKEDGCGPNSVTYSILIHGLCEVGKYHEAFCLKEEMGEKGCQPSTRTYTVLIKAYCDMGSIDKALSLLDEMIMKGCKANVHTYTVLIDGLCREGKIEEANGMFRTMLKDGLFPGTITYNTLINGYCKKGQVVSAFELLSVMERRNCRPNIRTYNELMEGLCRVNKSYKAMLLLERIVDNGLLPDRVTYNILINGFCKEYQLDKAFNVFKSMNSLGLEPDAFTFTSLIDGLFKQERPQQAIGMLGLMVKKGISPDEVTFTALIDGYCKIGQIGNAAMLFESMMENRCLTTSHTINLFLDVFCKDNKFSEENAMFGKILKYGLVPSVVTYTILIDGLCREGKISHSSDMMEMMKRIGCHPNVYTYTVVVNGLCQNGRLDEAEALLFSMSDLGVPPNHITYTVLVKAHVNSGRFDRALDIVGTMVKNGCQPNSRIYHALIAGLVLPNNAAEAPATGSNGLLVSRSLSSEENNDCCISNHVFREIDFEHALKLENKIEECGGSTTDLYNVLIVGLCRVGRLSEAYHLTIDLVKRGMFPDKAVSSIIEQYCKERKYDFCFHFMYLILDSGFVPSFASYCLVNLGLHNEGKIEQSQKLISDLLRHIGVEEKTAVLPYIEFLVKLDEHDKCNELLKLVEQLYYRQRPVI